MKKVNHRYMQCRMYPFAYLREGAAGSLEKVAVERVRFCELFPVWKNLIRDK